MPYEFLLLLPKDLIVILIILFAVIYIIDFFKATEIERYFENRRRKIVRRIINEIVVFLVVTFIATRFNAANVNTLSYTILSILLISYVLNILLLKVSQSKYYIFVNKIVIKLFRNLRVFKCVIFTINILAFFIYYSLLIVSTGYNIEMNFNTGQRSVINIINSAQLKDPNISIMFIAFFIVYLMLKTLLFPLHKLIEERKVLEYMVDIKLTNGEILTGLYIMESLGNDYFFVSNDIKLDKNADKFIINKDKIDYMRLNSKSKYLS